METSVSADLEKRSNTQNPDTQGGALDGKDESRTHSQTSHFSLTTEDGIFEVQAVAGNTRLGGVVVEGQIRGVVCGAVEQAASEVQDEDENGLEKYTPRWRGVFSSAFVAGRHCTVRGR